ncbi:MAG: carbohydrate kinase family protein [Oscillospiraceae bacterium]|nr:carbohydrate kinase family protein [Oscillospiraceae bacterium]
MNQKIIAAGHICIDITPVFPRDTKSERISDLLVPGRLIHMNGADVHTGGSVANTGLALKILGADVQLLGKVGNDAFGAMIRDLLAGYGAGGLIVDDSSSTSYSVVLAIPGIDRIFLHSPGANNTFTNSDIPEEALEGAALFHFGYPPVMKTLYENGGRELAAILRRVKEHDIATSLDMTNVDPNSDAGRADWEAILAAALPYTDFFVPSFEELCFMLDRERYDTLTARGGDMAEGLDMEADVKPLAAKCLELGAKAVLIKCGTSGMYYRTAGKDAMARVGSRLGLDAESWASKEGIQPCFRADQVLSGTGAGDTSIAAFLMAAAEGRSPAQCAALAAAEGACAVTAYDALSGLKPLKELEERIASGWETM